MLAAPLAVMEWREATDATTELDIPGFHDPDVSLECSTSTSSESDSSFDLVSDTSSFSFISDPETGDSDLDSDDKDDCGSTHRVAETVGQERARLALDGGGPYPGDEYASDEDVRHVEEKGARFYLSALGLDGYQLFDVLSESVIIPGEWVDGPTAEAFNIISWYTEYRSTTVAAAIGNQSISETPGVATAVLDSGATDHCFTCREDFTDYQSFTDRTGTGVEGSQFQIAGAGTVCKVVDVNGNKRVVQAPCTPHPRTSHELDINPATRRKGDCRQAEQRQSINQHT
ncbi:hypothetical protein FB45DRAFT_163005 [Roridomyces roridus]|uniref:Retrovirus-related Pol polyprotein from transposon TNT 1-94-like beta-barrel domain-containing protein n=1 Tax=Roridomyces roridus TaxID=1738132 RepID=A0AAD7BG79_9AGAR|nr:hypothetical protein FB45DRAFT_163005 [Roridomyces roridus]